MEIMNKPEGNIQIVAADVVRDYEMFRNIRRTAKVFCISKTEVRKILKQAGVAIVAQKKAVNPLHDVGMKESDFYDSNIWNRK